MSTVDHYDKIPNNVNLQRDRKLQRALEKWQPNFLNWWVNMGPEGFQLDDIYLRTAISADSDGWAHFDYVKMPDYRWGIFLADPVEGRTIGFGDVADEPAWQQVPGEHRNALKRLIVTQGDTEPASVEQQRLLGHTCPSLYDLRNLFQVNVEEGRHLWAMVYLLHNYFGRDGREEAEALLFRNSGNPDKPRILSAFNEPISDWLHFFMFTYFTDRDGKFQLLSLAESGFDPLARTTRFMLTEEAHHMFVGETGVLRVVQRACELMKESKTEDVRALGGIDLPLIQRYLNFWYSTSLDLFGGEVSSNAAAYFGAGLKGRAYEMKKYENHVILEDMYVVPKPGTDDIVEEHVPMRNALNTVLRDSYAEDCQRGVDKWNRAIESAGIDFTLTLPSVGFNRKIGVFQDMPIAPDGRVLSREDYDARKADWLPSDADQQYVASLMAPVMEVGKMANWLAPPTKGIKGKPIDFEYVRRYAGEKD
ncbi:MAG: benzoyl-CoA 2,3-epoxidase subunit BoxB [Candidatus Eisenbacteria bacterium]|uniref:Benzoyl-CoA 2,3-epoxidase subunit BoxB n=1 Tax=Eiseniibacteriota bacterium TaxID=2212470 RepID=A0A956NGJ9_UNCEI|nr:benzoyl-CoA 2,3-epoxidase subunit BoxB [Candidatus Eisenbacteria bacterium]